MAQNDSYSSEPPTGSSLVPRRQQGNQLPSAPVSTVNSSTSSPTPHYKKKRKRRVKGGAVIQEVVPPSALANPANTSPSLQPSSPAPSTRDQHAYDDSSSRQSIRPDPKSSFGMNRLAEGFARSHSFPDLASSDSRVPSQGIGSSQQNAIGLSDSGSDDEMEGSDGGMAVNLAADESESDHWMDQEINILSKDQHARPGTNADVKDPGSGTIRLADLNPDDLEDQLRYAMYHLQRHQIDLSRPVTCLACLREGHMADTCLEAHCTVCGKAGSHSSRVCPERGTHNTPASSHCFFPPYQLDLNTPVQLWISCCICASKSHLVGDCPELDENAAAERWSLKALDPAQVTNLSLQTGTRDREREAELRGMRPPGLHIRGRTDLHHAGAAHARHTPDDDEPFLNPPVASRRDSSRPQVKLGQYRPQRPSAASDRFDGRTPPSHDRNYSSGSRDNWYATDSFGKRRSRSPGDAPAPASPFGDSWRPEHHLGGRGLLSTRRFDGYRQDRVSSSSDFARRKPIYPPTSDSQSAPGRNQVKMQLPTRKGSNPNLAIPTKRTTNAKKTDAAVAGHKSNSDNVGSGGSLGGGTGNGGGEASQRKKGKQVKSIPAN
ncbi:hypothetical protein DV736_g915, partial [Chaetothyriales sp. CBS 134916]